MKDDLENVKNLGTSLMLEMSKITSDFKIGEDFPRGDIEKLSSLLDQHTHTHQDHKLSLHSDKYGPRVANFFILNAAGPSCAQRSLTFSKC